MRRTVVVVGAGLAGLSAVRALRGAGYDGVLEVVGGEPHPPYDRPPLSKGVLAGTAAPAETTLLADADEALDVRWRLGTAAVRLEPAERTVLLADGARLRGDGVVLATGARARRLPGPVPGGVHVLRTLDDALALRGDLLAASRLVVVGAGLVGLEVAATARGLGLDVVVVETLPAPLSRVLGDEMGRACAEPHRDAGVRLLTGARVAALTGSPRVEAVELADGRRLPADVVLVGIGAQADVEWLAGSGLRLDSAVGPGVVTDAASATALPGVVAVGDCALPYDLSVQRVARSEHWTAALQQPVTAAQTLLRSLAGDPGPAPPYTGLPYVWSEQYGRQLQLAGHPLPGDRVRVVDGRVEDRAFVAAYERDGQLVAVLALDSPRGFIRERKRLRAEHAARTEAARRERPQAGTARNGEL